MKKLSSLWLELRWFCLQFPKNLNFMGWIRIRMDPEVLPGSGTLNSENSELDPQHWLLVIAFCLLFVAATPFRHRPPDIRDFFASRCCEAFEVSRVPLRSIKWKPNSLDKYLSEGEQALLVPDAGPLDHDKVLLHLTVVGETAHRVNRLVGQIVPAEKDE